MSGFVPVLCGVAADRPDEADTVRNAALVAHTLEKLGHTSEVIFIDIDLTAVEKVAARAPLAVFNMVESIRGDGRLGQLACAALDHFEVPYTGAGTTAYYQSTSKLLTKALLKANGLPTPQWWLSAPPDGRRVIVKSVYEHASYGMDQGSVVDGARGPAEIASREKRFGGEFFCEDYVDGREFNVSVIEMDEGPVILPLAEMRFDALPDGVLPIVDYDAKWDESNPSYWLTKRRTGLEDHEPDLASRIRALTLACWQAADLRGYARVDFRVNAHGDVFILEFNANPCLAPDAGFAAALHEAGLRFEEGIDAIVKAARRTRRQ
ncbi:MAG: D-alanine--D-alanine ligase family protein [Inquilinaceae bacterium]